jgi:hypothetical protein
VRGKDSVKQSGRALGQPRQLVRRSMREMEPPVVLNFAVGQEFRTRYDSPVDPTGLDFRRRLITVLLSWSMALIVAPRIAGFSTRQNSASQ